MSPGYHVMGCRVPTRYNMLMWLLIKIGVGVVQDHNQRLSSDAERTAMNRRVARLKAFARATQQRADYLAARGRIIDT